MPDATAVKASYTDGEGKVHSIVSGYDLAATAIRPLGFEFGKALKDNPRTVFPGFTTAYRLIDKVNSTVKSKIHVVFNEINNQPIVKDIESLRIDSIKIQELTDEQKAKFIVHLDTSFTIEGRDMHFDFDTTVNVNIVFSQNVSVDVPAQKITGPTIHIEIPVDGSAATVSQTVVVRDNDGEEVGNATIPAQNVTFKADVIDDVEVGVIEVPGQTFIVPIEFNKAIPVDLKINKIFHVEGESFRFWYDANLVSAVESLWGSVQQQIGGVNTMLTDLNRVVKDANALIATLRSYEERIDNAVDNYTDRIVSYLDQINGRLVSVLNNINDYAQPCLLIKDEGIKMVSGSKEQSTYIKNSSVTLHPTTFTAEILTPCFKKHVAVTNVFKTRDKAVNAQAGDLVCQRALKAANETTGMNTVIDANVRDQMDLKNLLTGYTYEISYSAIDYYGNIVTNRFYIRH